MGTITKRSWQDGTVSYMARIRRSGQPHQTATFRLETDARKWIEEQELKINRLRHFGYSWEGDSRPELETHTDAMGDSNDA